MYTKLVTMFRTKTYTYAYTFLVFYITLQNAETMDHSSKVYTKVDCVNRCCYVISKKGKCLQQHQKHE